MYRKLCGGKEPHGRREHVKVDEAEREARIRPERPVGAQVQCCVGWAEDSWLCP